MKIAVDMDNTLFDDFGRRVRPGILELLRELRQQGHELVLWTSSTRERAARILHEHKVEPLFDGFRFREDYDPQGIGTFKDLRTIAADAIIDDDPKHIDFAKATGKIGILVSSYRGGPCRPDDLAHVRPALSLGRKGLFGWLRK